MAGRFWSRTASWRNVRLMVSASAVSTLGDGLQLVALPLLALTVTSSPFTIAVVNAASAVPILVLALPVGRFVDRVGQQTVMVVTEYVRAGVVAIFVVAVVLGKVQAWQIIVFAVVLGTGELLFDTSAATYLPSVVSGRQLISANSYLGMVAECGRGVIGPAIGGVVFAAFAGAPFAVNAVSFGLSGLLVGRLDRPVKSEKADAGDTTRPRFRRELFRGITVVWHHRGLRWLAVLVASWNFLGWMPESTFVLYARHDLGLSGYGYGLLFAVTSVGAVLGGLVAGRVGGRVRPSVVLAGSVAAYGALMFPPAAVHAVVLVGIALFLQGLPLIVFDVVSITQQQTAVDLSVLGRVTSVFRLISTGLAPLGLITGGALGQWLGLRAVFALSGAGLVLCALASFRGLRELRRPATGPAAPPR